MGTKGQIQYRDEKDPVTLTADEFRRLFLCKPVRRQYMDAESRVFSVVSDILEEMRNDFESQLDDKDSTIDELNTEIEELQEQINELQNDLDEAISERDEALDALDGE